MTVAALVVSTHGTGLGRPTFAEVAEANLDPVYRYLWHLVRDPHLAEDLTSETFERAMRMWTRYDPARGPVLPWLVTIGRRIALDHLRGESRRRARERRAAMGETDVAPAPPEGAGLPPRLRDALARLTDAEREIVALRVILDIGGAEAAGILGISATACSTQLHRAMTKLRKELEP
jgi:RNA polymerase sigma-70 factor (ECF subfamily)